ncbi:MAG: FecR domain-containing protein [Ferrovibrio sp.]|uniref:FecR family protein n=1 Tax=Ferrovibrio sp. TaxID=1917215 RepID=UPI00263856DC|nr:FecR domain-containing protein [Ferrovibrio sp.]MCW0233700.1 FecR domain-containing protein [Ferrovibrio sp.]
MDMPRHPPPEIQQQAADWFARLRGDADATVQESFARWVAADPAHAAAYARVEALWTDADLATALFAEAGTKSRTRGLDLLRRAAAVIVLLLGAGAVLHFSGLDSDLLADHVAPSGLPQRVNLPDGSLLLLDAGTAIDVDYRDGGRRIVLRRGRVLADVRPDTRRPFTITTASAAAQALGTVYSVAQRADGTSVAVREGEVLVIPKVGADPGTVLQAGQGMTVVDGQPRAAPAEDFAWAEGRLVFTDRPLNAVLADLDRYWPGLIWVRGDDLAALPVSGSYRLDDPPAVVAALASATGAQVSAYGGRLLVLSR